MKRLLPFVVLVSTAASAQGYDYSKKIGIGGGFGFEIPTFKTGFDTGDKSGETYNLHARYGLNSVHSLTFSWTRTDLAKTKLNADAWEVGILHRCMPAARFTPVFGANLGLTNYPNYSSTNKEWKPTARISGGAEYSITYNLVASANVDLKYINDAFQDRGDSEGQQLSVVPRINLTWFFGCGEACEKKEVPKSMPVVAKAVEMDSDKDGVVDSKDKCPNTATGAKVNAYGCVAAEKANIEVEVLFASGSAVLTSGSDQKIDELAAFLKEHPATKAEIQGHTDSSGRAETNKRLSQQRADAVKNYLVNKVGIKQSRLNAKGYGSDRPVADNATADGRAENRRVIAVIEE